ncbi:MAG TPA: thiamine diphosphokinase [Anaerolineae bacterium]|nr:thiamine diphosphokinase [Anaerolineae bacterium]
MRAVIFANGPLSDPQSVHTLLQPEDWLIAADGGAQHCLALNIQPDVIIGDFDSLEQHALEQLRQTGSELIPHDRHKDQTDLELALLHAQSQNPQEILILGAIGKRWDQTLANLLLPALSELSHVRIWFVDGHQRATVLHSGDSLEIEAQPGDVVSLVPIRGPAQGVRTHGLEYSLDGETLQFGSTLGISNTMLGHSASVAVESGVLVLFLSRSMDDRQNKEVS